MNYAIDLTLKPTTFDLWHVCLASTVVALALILVIVLLTTLFAMLRCKKSRGSQSSETNIVAAEPMVKVVEKIIEVEKIVEVEKLVAAPIPEPVILKEATPDAALQLLGLLQKEARFIDFIQEDIGSYSDADVGVAARVVHEGCKKAVHEHFTIAPIRSEYEGDKVTLPPGFDAASVRLTGHIVGSAPFTGTLVHKGWQVTDVRLAKLTQAHNANIVAAAEVEL